MGGLNEDVIRMYIHTRAQYLCARRSEGTSESTIESTSAFEGPEQLQGSDTSFDLEVEYPSHPTDQG